MSEENKEISNICDYDRAYYKGYYAAVEEIQAKIDKAIEEIENIGMGSYLDVINEIECNGREVRLSKKFATTILNKLIAEINQLK